MKTCVIQPPYCMDFGKSDMYFAWEIEALDRCTPDMDLIVLPEYSNVPCLAKTKAEMEQSFEKYGKVLLQKAAETAKRCAATLFVNCIMETPTGKRNTTVAFNKAGEMVGQYYKRHLVNSEMHEYELDRDYTYEHAAPTILEIDGVRYGFLICYDFYFYEAFANIARYNPDVIIACAYQRSDTHRALEIMAQFCAYNCNAYVVRSSVSLGENSPVGGCSMVVAPDGQVLLNLKNEASMGVVEFDPHA
ncbi:MAG: carbon-nitrogen hydrolase family protein, partial [Clostridia bacterium]|nr:carbon-nitrogen hydrolase family protein [Clostridia bacterium]